MGRAPFPSTPESMGMTPQDFIRHWSTPSFKVLETGDQNIFISRPDTGIRSIRRCETGAIICWVREDENNHKSTVVSWMSEGITLLPQFASKEDSTALGLNSNGSISVGMAFDGSKSQPVIWTSQGITAFPDLNNEQNYRAYGVNADGSIIVGAEGTCELREAVFWAAGKIFDLKKVLKEESIDFEWNVDLLDIYEITANGRQIVGFGEVGAHYDSSLKRMVSGYFFPFKAVLPPSFFEG